MRHSVTPALLTPGKIAHKLGEPLHRVMNVLRTRDHIRPVARAGTIRLYESATIAMVRDELSTIDARRSS